MTDAPITFLFAGLPAEYCFTTPQKFANDIAAGLSGILPGQYSTIINSEGPVDPADQDKLWHKWISGVPTGKIYSFYGGAWVLRNPEEPNSSIRRWWTGQEADIATYDGGDTDPSGDSSGPMWEVDHNYDFRFPLAAGTSPAPASTTVNPGDTGGEEKHVLTEAELAKHRHFVVDFETAAKGTARLNTAAAVADQSDSFNSYTLTAAANDANAGLSSLTGADTSHNNMPPYRVGFWIKRTARIFYKA